MSQWDWQGAFLVVVAVLALEGWPTRGSGELGAVDVVRLAFRPHVVLLLPALESAIDENDEATPPRGSRSQTMRARSEWWLVFSLGVVVAFAPLIAAGVMPDFVRQLSATAYGSAWGHDRVGQARPIALLAVVAIAWAVMPNIPPYSSVSDSLLAFRALVHGEESLPPPLGSLGWLRSTDGDGSGYRWSDYRDALSYLRGHTHPQTPVANVLRRFPFPSVNGPSGRLSPFRAESGICWMWSVNEDLDAEFAESLLQATDSVVIWAPNGMGVESRMRLPRVVGVIRRFYRPEARAGRIEIWRRTEAPSTPSPTPSP